MAVRLVAVRFDVDDPAGGAAFWAAMLGRTIIDEGTSTLVPGDDAQVGLRFVAAAPGTPAPPRLHLHLTSATADDQRRIVDRALALRGQHLDVGQLPDEGHVVLADPSGNAFCVIAAGNDFLAGCGPLGEVACDGTREVGLFWRDALGWPLVWDHGGETAVQSPDGGTKVSWGGPPVAAKVGRNGHRFDLETPDVPAEVARLVAARCHRARGTRRRRRAGRPGRQRALGRSGSGHPVPAHVGAVAEGAVGRVDQRLARAR